MSDFAINDQGEALYFDGNGWKPAPVATNERGEKIAFDGEGWRPIGPQPGFFSRAGDYGSTQVARFSGGIIGLPRMIAEGIDWLGRKDAEKGGTGARMPRSIIEALPTPQEATSTLIRGTNIKPTTLEGAMPGGAIIDAGLQGLLSMPFLGGTSGPALIAGALGGAGSEALGQAAEGTDLETPARIGGALLGGVAGVAGPALIGKIGRAGISLGAPFMPAGRERITGQALRGIADDPERAIANMEGYQPPVPGMGITASKAARDDSLMATENALNRAGAGFGEMANRNNALLTGELDRLGMGLPASGEAGGIVQKALADRFDAAMAARKAATDPLYTAARESPTQVKPFPLLAYTADTIKATKGEPQAVMQRARSLLFDKAGKADRTASGAMATREAINDMLDQDMGNFSKSLLMEMRSKLDDVLAAVPEEQVARTKFQEMSRPLDPFLAEQNKVVGDVVKRDRFGKDLMMPAEAVPKQFMKPGPLGAPTTQKLMMAAGGDPAVKQAMQSAYLADFRKSVTSRSAEDTAGNPIMSAANAAKWLEANKGGAANVLTADQVKGLEAITRALKDQAQTARKVAGSDTARNLATKSIIEAMLWRGAGDTAWLEPVRRALGIVYGGAEAKILDRLTEAMLDPKVAAALMRKATPGNVKMAEPALRTIGRAAALPASGDQR